jgi:LPS-assembly lipoprotein
MKVDVNPFGSSFCWFYRCCSLFLLSSLMMGCGFHFRGLINMPTWFTNVAVVSENANRDLSRHLIEDLRAYNIDVNSEPSRAQYWLILQQDNLAQHLSSVSSSTTPRQYELVYTVHFTLMKAKGKTLIPSLMVSVARQATINSDRILGSNQEESLLIDEMRRDAAIQILNRITKLGHIEG